jgi:hypothetical protein
MQAVDALRQIRETTRRQVPSTRLAEVVAFERAVAHYGWRWRTRGQPTDAAMFSIHRDIGYGLTFAVIVGAVLVEIVVAHLLLHEFGWTTAAWIVTVATLYGLFWLIADTNAIRLRRHRLAETHLDLCCGFRWDARVPWDAIESVETVGRVESDRERIDLVPFGSPKLVLHLRHPVDVLGVYGLRRRARRLGLVVDDRARFLEALREHLHRQSTPDRPG